jgi:hypothetical protein
MDSPSLDHSGPPDTEPREEVKETGIGEALEGQVEESKEVVLEEAKDIEVTFPLDVVYCPVCSFPLGFCEFGPSFDQCKRWIAFNCPELYPTLAEELAK